MRWGVKWVSLTFTSPFCSHSFSKDQKGDPCPLPSTVSRHIFSPFPHLGLIAQPSPQHLPPVCFSLLFLGLADVTESRARCTGCAQRTVAIPSWLHWAVSSLLQPPTLKCHMSPVTLGHHPSIQEGATLGSRPSGHLVILATVHK
jgi:hypothetical protein